jgi:hypothetical protein
MFEILALKRARPGLNIWDLRRYTCATRAEMINGRAVLEHGGFDVAVRWIGADGGSVAC